MILRSKYGLIDHHIFDGGKCGYSELVIRSTIGKIIVSATTDSTNRVFRYNSAIETPKKRRQRLLAHHFYMIFDILSSMVYETYYSKEELDSETELRIRYATLLMLGYNVFIQKLFPNVTTAKTVDVIAKECLENFSYVVSKPLKSERNKPLKKYLKTVDDKLVKKFFEEFENEYINLFNAVVSEFNKNGGNKSNIGTIKELIDEYLSVSDKYIKDVLILHTSNVFQNLGFNNFSSKLRESLFDLLHTEEPSYIPKSFGNSCGVFYFSENTKNNDVLIEVIKNTHNKYDKVFIYDFADGKCRSKLSELDFSDKITYLGVNNGKLDKRIFDVVKLEYYKGVYVDYDSLSTDLNKEEVLEYINTNKLYPILNSFDKVLTLEEYKTLGWDSWYNFYKSNNVNGILFFRCYPIMDKGMDSYTDDLDRVIEYLTVNEEYKGRFIYDRISNSICVSEVSEGMMDELEKVIYNNTLNLSKRHTCFRHKGSLIISEKSLKCGFNDLWSTMSCITSKTSLCTYNRDLVDIIGEDRVILL